MENGTKLIGYKHSEFTAKDGNHVKGIVVYFGMTITRNGEGMEAEKFFLSEEKLSRMAFKPEESIGRNVRIYFNRYGKPDEIQVLEED